jgi:hypothetical protein
MAMYVSKQPVSLLLPAAHKPWTSCCPRWPATSPAGWSHSSSGSTKDPTPPTSGYGEHCCAVVEEAEGREIATPAMLLQLRQLRRELCRGAYVLDGFRRQVHGELIPTLEPAYSKSSPIQVGWPPRWKAWKPR